MKRNSTMNKIFYLLLITPVLFFSCGGDEDPSPVNALGSEGFFVVNEGGFGNGNTSVSFYDRESGQITNNIFSSNNGIPLGDQAQSMTVHNGMGFIVVQGSAKLEVINLADFSLVATLTEGIESPRYFVGLNESKGYLSDWGADGVSGTVKVIDLSSFEVTKTIATGQGTDQLMMFNSNIYALNAGGWGRDNTIQVISTDSDEVINTVQVDDNPNSIQLGSDGNFWVAFSGHIAYDFSTFEIIVEESTPGGLSKISPSGDVITSLIAEEIGYGLSPSDLSADLDGTTLYYNQNGAVYSISSDASAFPSQPFISKNYYGLAVDPIDGSIIGCEAPDFTNAGNIDFYDASGNLSNSLEVGIAPNGVVFK